MHEADRRRGAVRKKVDAEEKVVIPSDRPVNQVGQRDTLSLGTQSRRKTERREKN